ncbi:trehalose-6-phosphate synthase [Dactylosporangium sucinum]|uniref:Trehalose-6-phosphate synthase n=2 Tax=Dactylosporangium sucinum TaxID=1424081 RepID=A0A917TTK7_9ACTN|nr:trehalose-6-phosphate synthase [Dactylosporangium sucinum]
MARDGAWIGWHGRADMHMAPVVLQSVLLSPVSLSAADIADHIDGQCASTIAPLYHDGLGGPAFHRRWRQAYRSVNERYAAAAAELAASGATVLVHGHELQLVPGMLRSVRPDLTIGFVLPLPLPPVELFRRMPMRADIVSGILGSDVIFVQDRRSADNLLRLAVGAGSTVTGAGAIAVGSRRVAVEVLPMGAETQSVEHLAAGANVRRRLDSLRRELRVPGTVLLSIDPLDGTSGAERRLAAFAELLHDGTLRAEECALIQVVVPAARESAELAELRSRVEQLAARINGSHGSVGRPVVHHLHRSLDTLDTVALFRLADVFLATALRDGGNPTAKAFVSARIDNTGALVLSEFSATAAELPQATLVNPYDLEDLKSAVMAAVAPADPAAARAAMSRMRLAVRDHDVRWWAGRVLAALDTARAGTTAVVVPGGA